MTCTACHDVLHQPTPGNGDGDTESRATELDWSLLEQSATATNACLSCRLIRSTVIYGTPTHATIERVNTRLRRCQLCLGVEFRSHDDTTRVWTFLYPFSQKSTLHARPLPFLFSHLAFDDQLGTPWPTVATSLLSHFFATDVEEAVAKIQHWIRKCNESHACFGRKIGQPPELPTRVIDVGGSSREPYLQITTGQRAHYAALSHSWGLQPSQVTRLTKDKCEAFCSQIELLSLPKTFRDAIDVCRRLGIRYLWIDSLCIIQDSDVDWHRESSQMTGVYQNACITLAADLAPNPDSGLFVVGSRQRVKLQEFELNDLEGKVYRIYIRREWPVPGKEELSAESLRSCFASEATSCLDKRAWVLQERILSARTVHSTTTEIRWECGVTYECSCHIPVLQKASPSLRQTLAMATCSRTADVSGSRAHGYDPSPWHDIVKNYSLRRLTYPTDRLAAISGIAGAVPLSAMEYCAGLWEPSLLYDLVWHNSSGHETWIISPTGKRSRLSTYSDTYPSKRTSVNTPSWTWSSITGPVKFRAKGEIDISIDWQLKEIKCGPSTRNPYGPVFVGSFIKLEGYLVPVTIEERHNLFNPQDRSAWIEMCIVRNDHKFEGGNKTWFDVDPELPEWNDRDANYHVLVIGTMRADGSPMALILKTKRRAISAACDDGISGNGRSHATTFIEDGPASGQKRKSGLKPCAESLPADEPAVKRRRREHTATIENGGVHIELDEPLAAAPEAESACSDQDISFTRIGIARLENWRGGDWKAGALRRIVKIV